MWWQPELLVFQVVAAYGAVPFPMMHAASLPDALSACREALPWKSLSACPGAADGRCYGQLVTLKGLEGQRLTRSDTLNIRLKAPAAPPEEVCRQQKLLQSLQVDPGWAGSS